jgi:hypothetical protein
VKLVLLALVACGSPKAPRFGSHCDSGVQCQNECATDPDFPNGTCTFPCTSDGECDTSSFCVVTPRMPICAVKCGVDGDCASLGSDYHCGSLQRAGTVGSARVCVDN